MGAEVLPVTGFAAAVLSERMGSGKWQRRCCGLFRCPEVVFVFLSIRIAPRLGAIRPDWLHSSRICRLLYLPSSGRQAAAALFSKRVVKWLSQTVETRLKPNDPSLQWVHCEDFTRAISWSRTVYKRGKKDIPFYSRRALN